MKKTLIASLLLAALSAQAETVFRRGNGSEPKSIDPQLASESSGSAIIYDTFEGLMTLGADASILPGVAEKWDISEDGKKYTFHLRDNAKWSNGDPVTAHDFVYAWQRAVNPATGGEYAFILYAVENAKKIAEGEEKDLSTLGIKAVDDRTLEITLDNPTPYFLDLLTHYTTYPVPQKVIEQHGEKWTQPGNIVSNGAYLVSEWQPQAQITAKKSDTYWNAANVAIDKVVYYATEEESSALKRYRADELDYILSMPIEQIDWAKENLPDELKISPYLATYWYNFNLTQPPFKDNPKLREALTLAIDRKVLVEKITKAGQTPAYSVVPPAIANAQPYLPDYAKLSNEERIKRAQQAYAEAGYSKDKPLKTHILYNTNEGHKKIAIAIAAMWKQTLGVETELENQEWKVMLENVRQKKYSVSRYAWIGDYNDPYTFLEIFQQGIEMNQTGFDRPDYDAKLKEAAATLDLDARAKLLHDAEKILTDEYAIMPIYHYVSVSMIKPYVKGYKENIKKVLPTQYLSIEK
ncbi:MAG: peptide ABC transporter substrate-binding protein [Cardiobacteriaceae bacterium]|nr:peptide ABC transporter substrate-binding protein [Cardiobacteriaceae bacterium]